MILRTRACLGGFRLWALVLALLLAAGSGVPAMAAEGTDHQAAEGGADAVEPETLVQLRSFLAPTVDTRGRRGTVPLTLVLKVYDEDDVSAVCRISPRLMDAVLQYLYADPIRLRRGEPTGLEMLSGPFLDLANEALGREGVTGIYVLNEVRGLSQGLSARLPFARILGCAGVGGRRH